MSEASPAPAAPAAPSSPAPSQAPTTSPAAASDSGKPASGDTAKPDAPARKAGDVQAAPPKPEERPDTHRRDQRLSRTEKQEAKKSASAELFERLKKGREQPEEPQADKPEERPAASSQRAPDGKFAPKEGSAKPEAPKPAAAPPEPPPRRDNGETEARLSRTVRELTSKTAEVETLKRTHSEAAAKLAAYEAREKREKDNPLEALHRLGHTLDTVVEGTVNQKYKAPWQQAQLPEEVRQELDSLKQFKERFETQERTKQQQQQRTADIGAVGAHVQKNAERYPFVAGLGEWAVAAIVDNTRRAGQADAAQQLVAFEKSMRDTMMGLALGNERVFDLLIAELASKPDFEKKLRAKYGAALSKETVPAVSNGAGKGSADGPRSVSSLPSGQTPPPATKQSKAERKRAAVRELNASRREADD
ncbi:MAG TPA: hypothetical protein VFZ61_03690 [Polyangiales bacterium]